MSAREVRLKRRFSGQRKHFHQFPNRELSPRLAFP
jgi:hypothetical protein